MSIFDHAVLLVTGIVAGSFSTLIGGGTLLTVPVLMLLGLPAHTAVATNRVGVFGLSITGWLAFQKQGLIRHSVSWALGLSCGAGAAAGTMIFLSIPDAALKWVIGVVSFALLLFTAVKGDIGVRRTAPESDGRRQWLIGLPTAFVLGAYGSIYGAGLGTFLTYLLVIVFGQTFLESAGTRKVSIGLQALISSALYWRAGLIDWPSAANLFAGMAVGSYVGAWYGARLGNVWIRRMFLALAAALTIKAVV